MVNARSVLATVLSVVCIEIDCPDSLIPLGVFLEPGGSALEAPWSHWRRNPFATGFTKLDIVRTRSSLSANALHASSLSKLLALSQSAPSLLGRLVYLFG